MRAKYPVTEEIDAVISSAYAKRLVHGVTLPALAKRFSVPKWWLKKRAMHLGLATQRVKAPAWTDDEKEIVATFAHLSPRKIKKKLIAAGFPDRSETGICVMRNRIGSVALSRADAGWYTANSLSGLIGKDRKCITAWIEKGWLKAKRGDTERIRAQGGDFWLIHEQDIRAFVIERAEQLDLGRWDRRFLVDVLATPKPRQQRLASVSAMRRPAREAVFAPSLPSLKAGVSRGKS